MTVADWVRWNRTDLDAREREQLLGGLTPEQSHRLLHNDYVWLDRVGVVWRPPDGSLRRARFTHGAHFETRAGAFHVDATGAVRPTSAPVAATLDQEASE